MTANLPLPKAIGALSENGPASRGGSSDDGCWLVGRRCPQSERPEASVYLPSSGRLACITRLIDVQHSVNRIPLASGSSKRIHCFSRSIPHRYRQLFLAEGHWQYTEVFWDKFIRGCRKYDATITEWCLRYFAKNAMQKALAGQGIQEEE